MQNIIILKCQHVRIACGHFDIILSTLLNILLIICQTVMQQYFSYIVAVSFIGGGNQSTQRKPQTCRKSLTNFIT